MRPEATFSGAAVLATGAAVHGGAGMVRYVGSAAQYVRGRWPEAIVTDGRPGYAYARIDNPTGTALADAIGNGGEKLFRFEKRRAGELFFFARYRLTQRFVDLRLVWRGARLRCPLF